jgi:hypothetical protein
VFSECVIKGVCGVVVDHSGSRWIVMDHTDVDGSGGSGVSWAAS